MGIFTERLRERAEPAYAKFMAGILPTVDKRTILGVRAPVMRGLVREVRGTPEAEAFLKELPHRYYDENALHAWLITEEKDFSVCLARVREFLPFVDNWGICDGLMPAVFKKHTAELRDQACAWARSSEPYVCRYGLGVLMWFFLDEAFEPEFMELAAEKVCHGDNVTGAQGPQPGVQRLGALLGERDRFGRLLFHAADFCAETFQGVKWKKLAGALGAGQMGRTAAAGGAR